MKTRHWYNNQNLSCGQDKKFRELDLFGTKLESLFSARLDEVPNS